MLLIMNKIFSLVSQIFVDNSEFVISNKGNKSELQIISRSQKVLDSWYSGLKFIGRELKLSKCY